MAIDLKDAFDVVGLSKTSWNAKMSSIVAGGVGPIGAVTALTNLKKSGSPQGSFRFAGTTLNVSKFADATFEFSAASLGSFESGMVYSNVADSDIRTDNFQQSVLILRDSPPAGEGLGLICFSRDLPQRVIDAIITAFKSSIEDGVNSLVKASESVAVVSGDSSAAKKLQLVGGLVLPVQAFASFEPAENGGQKEEEEQEQPV